MSEVHYLKPDSNSLHGFFSKDLTPAIEIASGDSVIFQTLDAAWGIEKRPGPGQPRKKFTNLREDRKTDQFGHALVGPVYIKEAKPGQTLEVKINKIVPGEWGWTSAGGFPSYWNKKLGMDNEPEVTLDFNLDHKNMIGRSFFGNFDFEVKLHPFMGIMGMPPDESGHHSTVVPRFCGGNIDCKELQAGSTLYLPIPVEGALFSLGEGHAAQGDGEVGGPALECPMDHVDITFTLRDDLPLSMPMAKTEKGWITLGVHENLEEAMWIALKNMIDFIAQHYNLSRSEAHAYATMVVDLRITQIVNFSKGVHAFLPIDAIK
ncbi:acetamidase/formamidase family protein [Pseudalkalibacillus caeni]|uniref:Acetamidase n=1 Tax=Exobacillus caeni TaxID=2574798 RepID=A0A5R9EY32_9BACL|nr:acetamidase/formamidase family protein [Pseudalkalibacillus caeni]TLS36192.1 acetamidase [Pseudalkalibacillus caeni]